MKRVLFVCTGNMCRSPMAEAIFKARMPAAWGNRIHVSSAGTGAWEGQPASQFAVEVLRDEGIDLSSHRARLLTREMVESSDVVVAMTRLHWDTIRSIAPEADAEIVVLGELDSGRVSPDIEDPIGGDRSVYEQTRDKLNGLIRQLIDYLVDLFDLEE